MLAKKDYIEILEYRIRRDYKVWKRNRNIDFSFGTNTKTREYTNLRKSIHMNCFWLKMIKRCSLKILGEKQLKECLIDRGFTF